MAAKQGQRWQGQKEIETRPNVPGRGAGGNVEARNSFPSLINFPDHVESAALQWSGGRALQPLWDFSWRRIPLQIIEGVKTSPQLA